MNFCRLKVGKVGLLFTDQGSSASILFPETKTLPKISFKKVSWNQFDIVAFFRYF
jgi:hypothetical protein